MQQKKKILNLNLGASLNVSRPMFIFRKIIFFFFVTACLKGNLRIATLLVEKGADVNLKDDEHHTPLHLSCQVNIMFTKKTIFF